MSTLPAPSTSTGDAPLWKKYQPANHYRSKEEEFDACKLGMWLFLTTEVLLFAGIFVGYAIFRMLYPQAWANGSSYLDWRWGGLNTVVLLVSSYTMAVSIHHAQLNNQAALRRNLLITILCGAAFIVIKLTMEYIPKWSAGKAPGGSFFNYPFASDPHEPLWWGIYYCGTGIHALHVIIGMSLIFWVYLKARKGHYGPNHYTGVEVVGLYWHLVDLIWIFLFPLLYLIG